MAKYRIEPSPALRGWFRIRTSGSMMYLRIGNYPHRWRTIAEAYDVLVAYLRSKQQPQLRSH